MNKFSAYPVIGNVTTKPLTLTGDNGQVTLILPGSTYEVFEVVENFGGSGKKAYVTNHEMDHGEPLVIVDFLVESYQPI